jgi:catechol 2,3-dioxygenase-like lactoylglutathione lyase family enzyme
LRITHIDHFNISLKHADLEIIRDFYVNVIGLTEGARPNFNFPGYARARLKAAGVPFDERPVPGWRLNQIFFKDPAGLKVELTFDMEREDHLLK